ncbi:MAG: glycosyltransferase family 39 protein [Nitrospirae bacterium]|nr:glycosyltransferase family 39 protein [Nitrospirota bacterium]
MSLPEIDTALFFVVNKGLQNSFFDILMPFVTGNAKLLFLPLVIWTFFRDRRDILTVLSVSIVAVAFADGLGHVIKILVARVRPCNALEDVRTLVGCGSSFSMPSNHAINGFGFAMAFWFLRKDVVRPFFVLVAVMVGFSRVYVGVHYPFDVLAGAVLGTGAAWGAALTVRQAKKIYADRDYDRALYLGLMLISLFRIYYIITSPFDLSPDEAHYWEWSRRPDLSYYSKGPMIAYIILAGTKLFGSTVFGVRIFAVIFSALSSLILYRLGRDLYDARTGLFSALLVQIVPLYSVFGVLLTIDSPFIFFWVLSLFFFRKALDSGLSAGTQKHLHLYWVLTGVTTGLGILTKYTMAFFPFSGLLFMLFYRDARRLLASRGPYLAAAASAVISSPVIIWNAANGWVTVKHTAGQAHIAEGFKIALPYFFEFLGSQIGIVTPVLMVLIFIALWRSRKERAGAFLFWFSFPVIVFFLMKSLQGKVQANWALPGYAAGFIAFSAYYMRNVEAFKRPIRVLVLLGFVLALSLTFFAHFPAFLHLPPDKDPTAKLVGWKELGKEASLAFNEISSGGPAFIVSDSYQIASELAFYMKDNPVTYCVNLGRRMNQYDLWPGFERLAGYNAVLVMTGHQQMPGSLIPAFGRYERRLLVLKTRQHKLMKFTVFKCYDFRGMESKSPEKF